MKILVKTKKCLILVIIHLSQKFMMIQNKLVVGKMNDEAADIPIKEFLGLKPKMHSFLVDGNIEHKKSKGMNKIVVATISHG